MINDNTRPIYLQIADSICDDILASALHSGDRLPSVREYAARMQVNPNTVMRTYDTLSQQGIIFNRRGVGYFVAEHAADAVRADRAERLLNQQLLDVFNSLWLMGITPAELLRRYETFITSKNNNSPQQ